MSSRAPRARRLPGGWCLLILWLHAACATGGAPASERTRPTPELASATESALGFLEPGAVSPRPVPIASAEFKQALQRLAHDVRLTRKSPREAAHALLNLAPQSPREAGTVASQGDWTLETYRGQGYTLVPERQEGPVHLTSQADEALKEKYLRWCVTQGGGDCLGLLDDGPHLRAEDKRTLALALAFGTVLDETRAALARELLEVRALVSMVVWTVALYCAMWMVPEPTTKAVAATLTVVLMGWLGLETVYGLMDGWARMANASLEATTFEELRAAGETFGKVLGEDAARALILAVAALTGRTLGDGVARVKSLPGFGLAGARWEAQGGAALLSGVEGGELALAPEGALARAVAAVETVATSPQGPLAVVMFKTGPGGGTGPAPGGRSSATVLRHRGGNRQVELSDGQRWHLPRGKSVADIPAEDKVGDQLQEEVTRAAKQWGPDKLSRNELAAIKKAEEGGKYWLARLLEREARGRYVHEVLKTRFQRLYRFNPRGADVMDPSPGGHQYEILSGTESNLARHGRRMAGEFFRMLTF